MKYFLFFLIKIYQVLISPDHSILGKYFYPIGLCRFYPTCSEITKKSILKYGTIKGICGGINQLKKCI